MKKKVVSIALTGALAFGAFTVPFQSEHSLFNSSQLVAEAAATDFSSGKKIEYVEKVRTGETGNYDHVQTESYSQSKAGTVIFKIKPSSNSSWNTSKKLSLSSSTYIEEKMESPKLEVYKDYVLVFVYVKDPKDAMIVTLKTQNGEYGNDPFNYEAVYVAGKDLTKTTSITPAPKPTTPTVAKKVYWDGIELRKGQIGKITVDKPINIWKREGGKLKFSRVLNKGEQYRVYTYDSKFGGQYGLGGGLYVTNMKTHITYKTPPKAKLAELNKQ